MVGPLINSHLEKTLIRQLPYLEDLVNTFSNERNQLFCAVKSHFLSFIGTNLKNKFVNVMSFKYLYGCYKWKSNFCAEYWICVGKTS